MSKISKEEIIAALYAAQNIYCDSEHPLKGGSGLYQPIYLDHRNLLSFPKERGLVLGAMKEILADKKFDLVAGNETAGIAYAALLADLFKAPMIYVRKQPKEGGTKKQIEGVVEPGQIALVVDDIMITGGNIERAVLVLKDLGVKVHDVAAVSVAKKEVIEKRFDAMGVKFHYLVTFQEIVDYGIKHQKFSDKDVVAIKEYLADPINWGKKHGFE